MKRLSLLPLILIICTLSFSQEHQIKSHKHLTQNTSLLSNKVFSITEDTYGRIWISTEEGINIYNGKQVKSFTDIKKDDFFDHRMARNLIALGDRIIISGNQGVFEYNCITNDLKIVLQKKLIQGPVHLTKQGENIYILCDKNIHKYNGEKIEKIFQDAAAIRLVVDRQNNIWTSDRKTITKYNYKGSLSKTYDIIKDIPNIFITVTYCDNKGVIWFGTKSNGVFRYDKTRDRFTNIKEIKKIDNVCSIGDDYNGNLWIGYNNGIIQYDYINDNFEWNRISSANGQKHNITVCEIFRTSADDMILGTFFNGLFYIKHNSWLNFLQIESAKNTTGIVINNIIKTKDDHLIVGSNSEGIHYYDKNYQQLKFYNSQNSIIDDNIIVLCEDDNGAIWAGSESKGIYYIPQSGKILNYTMSTPGFGLKNNLIRDIKPINKNSLLICTNLDISILDLDTHKLTTLMPVRYELISSQVNKDTCIICCEGEVLIYDLINKKGTRIPSINSKGDIIKLSAMYYRDSVTWFGSVNNGIFYLDKNKHILPFDPSDSFNKKIQGLALDKSGNIWLSTTDGLYVKDKSGNYNTINTEWGLNTNRFNTRSSLQHNETIYFGTINGLCYFNPSDITQEKTSYRQSLLITDIKVFNQSVRYDRSIISGNINNSGKITLKHNQDFFSIELSHIDFDFQNRDNNKILYQLENFNSSWFETDQKSELITYTSLKPGNYVLNIKVVNSQNETIDSKRLFIYIKPHLLYSKGFIFIYLLLLLFIIYLIYKSIRRKNNQKVRNRLKQLEKEQLEAITNAKFEFFTQVTNELRAPLAVLLEINKDLFGKHNLQNTEEYRISERNINRLHILINQLIEFRALETNHLPLNNEEGDIISFCKNIFTLFIPLFNAKGINCEFISPTQELNINFDKDKIEKILSNVISNIIKITKQEADVSFEIKEHQVSSVILTFHISELTNSNDKIEHLFNPKDNDFDTEFNHSTLGRVLVSRLVEVIDSEIIITKINKGFELNCVVTSGVKTKGSSASSYEPNSSKLLLQDFETPTLENYDNATNPHKLKALVVEYDLDFAYILKNKLEKHYNVTIVENGRLAYNALETSFYDIIISNINIDQLSGFELCTKVKNHPNYKHIPVILISNKNSTEDKIQSFKLNANGYIEKPFYIDELILKANSLLTNKESLRNYYGKMTNIEIKEKANTKEEHFIAQLNDIISKNLASPEFNVTSIAKQLHISRTQLYLQTKEIAGISPSELVIKRRMERSKELLSDYNNSISDVAYQLGYNSANYFSKQFKSYFNKTPKQFRSNK